MYITLKCAKVEMLYSKLVCEKRYPEEGGIHITTAQDVGLGVLGRQMNPEVECVAQFELTPYPHPTRWSVSSI